MTIHTEKKIFLVDPDIAVRDSVRVLMESYGMYFRAYASGRSFLNNARINTCDCVLVENYLPDMSGMDVLVYLKQRGINVPFVLLSSANDTGFEEMAISQDIAAVMRKPLHGQHLIEMLNAL